MKRLQVSILIALVLHVGVLFASAHFFTCPPVIRLSPGKLKVHVAPMRKQEKKKPEPKPIPKREEPPPKQEQNSIEQKAEPAWVDEADYFRNPPPRYPYISRKRGEMGTVILLVRVNELGRPAQVQIHQSSGFARLDKAAREGVMEWIFTPAQKGGNPISMEVLIPIRFCLR